MSKLALPIRIVLLAPPKDVVYGIQRGRGSHYQVALAQQRIRGDITFDFEIAVVDRENQPPNFLGEFVQGPAGRRFIYIDVGRYAKQADTPWARRMIVRLDDVTWPLLRKAMTPGKRLEARIQGTGGDGGPSCATVPIVDGWRVVTD